MRKTVVFASLALATAILALILLPGCTITTTRPSEQTTTTSEATDTGRGPTTSTTEREIALRLYFVESFSETSFLVPENRPVERTQAVARAALQELIRGPRQTGRATFIPAGTQVRSVRIDNGLATVDFSREILNARVGAEGERLGIWQIVNTLTEFENIERVQFLVEGRDRGRIDGREISDWWGHIGLADQPFERDESLIQGGRVRRENIVVDEPRAFSTVENPLRVRGRARVFEAQFQVRVLDVNGAVLADEPVLAEDFNFGPFNKQIRYRAPQAAGRGTVHFYYHSPRDGSEVTLADVPVFLSM